VKKEDIILGLKQIGLKKGDIVLLHSSLSSLGHVDGGAHTVVEAFLELLDKTGTLVVPAFHEPGAIPDLVKKYPEAICSVHPLAAVCAIGGSAEKICADHWKQESAFGEGTPYSKVADMGGYVCLMGVDQNQNSSLHYVEAKLNLDYLRITPEYTFETPEGLVTKNWEWHPGGKKDFLKLDRVFLRTGIMRIGEIGDSVVRLMRSSEMLDNAYDEGINDPAFFLSDNPNCLESVKQKAALSQGLIAQEDFTLVVASSLAGWYVPQMIDEMRDVGIDNVSIDMVQGKPIHTIGPAGIKSMVKDFRKHGCEVASLRLLVAPEDYETIIETARENEIHRIVMPLCGGLERMLEFSELKGVHISFFNISINSEMATNLLLDYHEKGYAPSFTFNGANFARVYEKPYQQSYRQKLHRFIDQLDLEDSAFDGQLTALGDGNGDVKEMISILRCHSFTGNLMLTGGNLNSGKLIDCVKKFVRILRKM
jgi:aminoglycoside 3-N-acetyltransferase